MTDGVSGDESGDESGDDSDEALLRRWQADDRRAGQRLARRYFPLVRSYFRVKAPADYPDLVANTFLRLVEKHDSYRGEGSFRCFVLGIARKILLESFRAQKRDQRIDPLVTTAHDLGGRGLISQLSHRQEHILLIEALRRLPLAKQELLELYYWQQLTAVEIGEFLAAPEPTVRTRIRRALLDLAQEYRHLEQSPRPEPGDLDLERWMAELRGL